MAILDKFLKSLFGDRNERVLKKMLPTIERINSYEPEYEKLTDEQLRDKTAEFRKRLSQGETRDDILPEAFAVGREAAKRTIGERPFDVQLMGGIVMHNGGIAEMMTGEGKTLTSVAPGYLNALDGKVHIVTVNDYLARRDAAWMGNIYGILGLSVGCIQSQMHSNERIPQYECDVTYGTNSEFGFDYLRDNMKTRLDLQCQKHRHFAIIDEVDSILIDEARTPLIISGPSDEATENYYLADRVVRRWIQNKKGADKNDLDDQIEGSAAGTEREHKRLDLEKAYYFVYSEKSKSAYLTDSGIIAAQKELGVEDFYALDAIHDQWPHHLEQAVRAHQLFVKDVDYVPKDNEIVIVDEFTGRLMEGRRWSDGLHQAIEAKEDLKIREEFQTLATVTIQNFFRLYDKLSGMTGTALTEAGEFHQIYTLDVLVVPTNRPLIRTAFDDRVYLTEKEKYLATAAEIERVHATGRPILVGTTSIERSEKLSAMLQRRGVPHEVLNAKHHEREAHIVANAGQLGAVTIATNMAGRGTDILLGNFESEELQEYWQKSGVAPKDLRIDDPSREHKLLAHWAKRYLPKNILDKLEKKKGDSEAKRTELENCWATESMAALPTNGTTSVAGLGGLHIIGTERHESRRIDNQLRGRSGRQGDPGSSTFFVSLEDDLMRRFAREGVKRLLARLGMGDGQEISYPMVTRAIERAQKKVEEHNFDIRKNLLEYDKVNDEQRKTIYDRRTAMLRGEQLEETVWQLVDLLLDGVVAEHMADHQPPAEWDVGEVAGWARRKFGVEVDPEELRKSGGAQAGAKIVRAAVERGMERIRELIGEEGHEHTLRFLLLRGFDEKWKEHLRELDDLRRSIGLRGYGQKDPKMEYRQEATRAFQEMEVSIAESVTDSLLKIQITDDAADDLLADTWNPASTTHDDATAYGADGTDPDDVGNIGSTPERIEPIKRDAPKVGRNDPCPCGSGKKYKKCHGIVEL
ncbi:MAG: preprotein translocase subunit SecA [Planctomycetota bacterium]